ncbi:hypothetical protein [Neoasaia chiangmaiensis]|nr:hypothetical protein [Neoasaia chiangmaiensis]
MRHVWGSALAVLTLVAGLGVSNQAHAQRVISDYEASKLTLDALTATPVYHRPVVHHVMYRPSHTRFAVTHGVAHGLSRRALIHNVVYHPKAASVSKHHHTRRRG